LQVITDLNNPEGVEPAISTDPEKGEQLIGSTAVNVGSVEQCTYIPVTAPCIVPSRVTVCPDVPAGISTELVASFGCVLRWQARRKNRAA
jgi:hypothetical protein